MPLIECLKGGVSVNVGGLDYSFERDQYHRFVARVDRLNDVKCFMGNDLYRIVPDVPEAEMNEREERRIAAEKALAAAVAEEERIAAEKAAAEAAEKAAAEAAEKAAAEAARAAALLDQSEGREDEDADQEQGAPDASDEDAKDSSATADVSASKKRGRPSRKA